MLHVLNDWLLTQWRLAVHEPTSTAVLADLHLGYREARRNSGEAVPLLTLRAQLAPFIAAHKALGFRNVLVAGDMFERTVDAKILDEFLLVLTELGVHFTGLVPGNHDRGWEAFREHVPMHPDGVDLGGWHVLHAEPGNFKSTEPSAIVVGHHHPATRYQGRRVPCYLASPRRLVLPAYSADAVGQVRTARVGCVTFPIFNSRVINLGANDVPPTKNAARSLASASKRSVSRALDRKR